MRHNRHERRTDLTRQCGWLISGRKGPLGTHVSHFIGDHDDGQCLFIDPNSAINIINHLPSGGKRERTKERKSEKQLCHHLFFYDDNELKRVILGMKLNPSLAIGRITLSVCPDLMLFLLGLTFVFFLSLSLLDFNLLKLFFYYLPTETI